jgi:hypothetical protein
MSSFGELVKVGVEGTGSCGAGLARYLTGRGAEVAEVTGRTGRPAAGAASPTPVRMPRVARRMRSGGALTSSGKAPAPPGRQGCAASVRRSIVGCALPAADGWYELAMNHIAGRLRVGPWRSATQRGITVAEHRSHGSLGFRGCSYGCSSPGSGGGRMGSYAQVKTLADLRDL